jgi:hypothetical protein
MYPKEPELTAFPGRSNHSDESFETNGSKRGGWEL